MIPLNAPAIIGCAAALCSMASFVPQVFKILREHDAASVSATMYAVTVLGFLLWAIYGVQLRSWPLVVANLVCMTLAAAVLVLKLLDRGDAE